MTTYAGGLYYSFVGTTWVKSNTNIYFPSMHHAKGIIIGGTESKGLYYSMDNGVTWVQSNISSGKFKYIYYANGVFLTWDLTTSLYYSYDWKTWTNTNKIYPFTQILNADGIWVALRHHLIILEYLHIQSETAMCLLPVSDYFLY